MLWIRRDLLIDQKSEKDVDDGERVTRERDDS